MRLVVARCQVVYAGRLTAHLPMATRVLMVKADGSVLVHADRGCFSCMLGGDDGRTLFIIANNYGPTGASDGVVLTHPVDVPHAGRP